MMPTKDEIKKFLDVVEKLTYFELEHRANEGWGLWSDSDNLPIPESVKVFNWLKTLSCENETM